MIHEIRVVPVAIPDMALAWDWSDTVLVGMEILVAILD